MEYFFSPISYNVVWYVKPFGGLSYKNLGLFAFVRARCKKIIFSSIPVAKIIYFLASVL
jgi:hypothetical protein